MDGCAHAQLLKADRQPFSGPTWLPETAGRRACIGVAVSVQCSFPFARGQGPLCPAVRSTAAVVSWGQKTTGHGEGQLLRQKAQLGHRLLTLSEG